MDIEWLAPAGLGALRPPGKADFAWALALDLRDPLALPLLRPAPLHGDYLDERRPAASDRTYFLARRAALRSFVAQALRVQAETVEIGSNAAGAPRLLVPAAGLFVSVSGRGPAALLGVATRPIGVDFEPLAAVEPIPDVLHPLEQAALAKQDDPARGFLALWTAKEAYLKALGDGLNRDPASIAISASIPERLRVSDGGIDRPLAAGALRALEISGVPVIASCIVLAE